MDVVELPSEEYELVGQQTVDDSTELEVRDLSEVIVEVIVLTELLEVIVVDRPLFGEEVEDKTVEVLGDERLDVGGSALLTRLAKAPEP